MELVSDRVFRAAEFFERRDGVCRLMASMASELSDTADRWRQLVAPAAEWVAEQLNQPGRLSEDVGPPTVQVAPLPTKLTESRRGALRRPAAETAAAPQPGSCTACGAQLASRRVKYCVKCREIHGHRGRRSSLTADRPRPTEAEIRRLLRALRDLRPEQWIRIDTAIGDAAAVARVERLARTHWKRVPVRLAKDPDLLTAALTGCPAGIRQTGRGLIEGIVLAAAVMDELRPGEFERLYELLAVAITQAVWAGDELLSQQDREAMSEMHAGGMSASRTAQELGISRESVLRRLKVARK